MTQLVCERCGWTTAADPYDRIQSPGPATCPMNYTGPEFPVDRGHPSGRVGGPCNGSIVRRAAD